VRKVFLHPLVVFFSVWGAILFAYSLRWSQLQELDLKDGLYFYLISAGVFIFVSIAGHAIHVGHIGKYGEMRVDEIEVDRARLRKWFLIWFGLTFVEIVYSGGLPLEWIIIGSDKTYFDFGLPTVHGLLNGLISTISVLRFFMYQTTKHKSDLWAALFVILWGVMAVTRQLIIVNLFQFLIVYAIVNRIRIGSVVRVALFAMFIGLAFGWLGDARTGADKFIGLAMPSSSYPDYLPSGALWVYMYVATPIMNLLRTINTSCGCESYLFANTLAPLLPSIVRVMLLPADKIEKGNVVSEAFNVSTAFVDSYTDAGYLGIFGFTLVIASISVYFWYRLDKRGVLMFAVLTQCLLLTIFYNHFFSLPVISQVAWIALLLPRGDSSRRASTQALVA